MVILKMREFPRSLGYLYLFDDEIRELKKRYLLAGKENTTLPGLWVVGVYGSRLFRNQRDLWDPSGLLSLT